MAKVQGTWDDRFVEIQKMLQANIDNDREQGASIVINIDGKEVVDMWGGYADIDKSRPWEADTITNIWSTTKTATSLAALTLIDRGLLDPNEKVAKYWPEFAANGKENIEVKHFLSHASGLSGWQVPVTFEDVCDLEKSTKLLAEQAPWWEPGTASGYHSLTYGHLVGELVRRVTGKTLGQFITEDLAQPRDADFQLGLMDDDLKRVSNIIPPPPMEPKDIPPGFKDPTSLPFRSFMNPMADPEIALTPVWRKGQVGAANGHSNARGVSRLLSTVTLGPQHTSPLLSDKTVDLIFHEQQNGKDLVIDHNVRLGMGFGLKAPSSILENLPDGRVCTWGGWGGSVVICDVGRKVTFAYVMNKMYNTVVGSDLTQEYIAAVWKALDA